MNAAAAAIARLAGSAVRSIQPMAGGDLSSVSRVVLDDGQTIVAKQGPLVSAEARMLAALGARGVPVPAVVGCDGDLLLMTLLPSGGALDRAGWGDLAALLLRLCGGEARYGWDEDYAFGAVVIDNRWREDWPTFWAEARLACHLPHLPVSLARRVEALAARIGDLVPARPPVALLHGDLWGGNVLADDGRVSGLIDPACYYGDREVDVAMLTLFDAPPERFFALLGLDPGWEARQPVYRLWPLLVHVRLFGGGYVGSAHAALDVIGIGR